tara:strand:+ start:3945 stop:4088 length:144 start_codon:yes stop_codon:yes gene_type:complete
MIGLFLIGMLLTIIGLYVAYRIGSKQKLEEKDPNEWIKGYKEWKKKK